MLQGGRLGSSRRRPSCGGGRACSLCGAGQASQRNVPFSSTGRNVFGAAAPGSALSTTAAAEIRERSDMVTSYCGVLSVLWLLVVETLVDTRERDGVRSDLVKMTG